MRIRKIAYEQDRDNARGRYIFYLDDEGVAEHYCASCLMSVRNIWHLLELYVKDSCLVLDGPIMDSAGKVVPEQKNMLKAVAVRLKNTIENDVPEFRRYVQRIIKFTKHTAGLPLETTDLLDCMLMLSTKQRLMQPKDFRIYGDVIKKAVADFQERQLDIDKSINNMLNDTNFITELMRKYEK